MKEEADPELRSTEDGMRSGYNKNMCKRYYFRITCCEIHLAKTYKYMHSVQVAPLLRLHVRRALFLLSCALQRGLV